MCEALLAPALEGRRGAAAALLSVRGPEGGCMPPMELQLLMWLCVVHWGWLGACAGPVKRLPQ